MDIPSYLLGKKSSGGGSTPVLQDKDVTITSNGTQTVTADTGYDGLRNVEITTSVPGITPTGQYYAGQNGTYNIAQYETVKVAVPQGIFPTGTLNITENNTYDVTNYASAVVNVSGGGTENAYINGTITSTGGNSIIYFLESVDGSKISFGTNKNISSLFKNCANLVSATSLDMSNITNASEMFNLCRNLQTVSLINTVKLQTASQMFSTCTELVDAPQMDTSKVTGFYRTFYTCSKLENVPVYDSSSMTNMSDAFYYCTSLTNASLNNIMAMCINSNVSASNKTLKYVGLTQEQTQTCATLSNYQDLLAAGWTTGY